ncbi:MAG: helix-turn-helix transcriptional regulator [Verrucomicrobia bacterium]|nr:helix-turn-helix transcriptional regulator [Verrucomicrobiota bacterium]
MDRCARGRTRHQRVAGTACRAFRSALSCAFKRVTGCSPKDHLLRRTVERAAEQLRTRPALTVTAMAHEPGFSNSQHFASVFRRHMAMSPREFRSLSWKDNPPLPAQLRDLGLRRIPSAGCGRMHAGSVRPPLIRQALRESGRRAGGKSARFRHPESHTTG